MSMPRCWRKRRRFLRILPRCRRKSRTRSGSKRTRSASRRRRTKDSGPSGAAKGWRRSRWRVWRYRDRHSERSEAEPRDDDLASMIRFFNTYSRALEEFAPRDPPNVSIYTCGPTVYSHAHIGNFRAYIFEDLLQRHLEARGFNVRRIMNITDFDD